MSRAGTGGTGSPKTRGHPQTSHEHAPTSHPQGWLRAERRTVLSPGWREEGMWGDRTSDTFSAGREIMAPQLKKAVWRLLPIFPPAQRLRSWVWARAFTAPGGGHSPSVRQRRVKTPGGAGPSVEAGRALHLLRRMPPKSLRREERPTPKATCPATPRPRTARGRWIHRESEHVSGRPGSPAPPPWTERPASPRPADLPRGRTGHAQRPPPAPVPSRPGGETVLALTVVMGAVLCPR